MSEHQLLKQLTGLSRLVQIEWEARQAASNEDLFYIAANDTHRLVPYDHALIWFARSSQVMAVSGSVKVEPHASQIAWFGQLGKHLASGNNATESKGIDHTTIPKSLAANYDRWIEATATWIPLSGPNSRIEGGIILLRKASFNEAELRTLGRLGNAYGSALTALNAPAFKMRNLVARKRLRVLAIGLVVAGLMAVRWPMSVLAEAHVAPSEPKVVTAPIEGVISQIEIKPNQDISSGQVVVRFDQTKLHAARQVVLKRVAVLSADSRRAEAQAFADPEARAQISHLRAKLAEGRAELVYAQRHLEQTVLRAPASGIALIDNINGWIGRPVKVGERILVVANPGKALLEIEVEVEDALFVTVGAQVEFFLATAPADPIKAHLTRISYSARLQPDQTTKFIAEAEFEDQSTPPRLGLTGTAKIIGPRVSVAYMLFRKPLAKLRRLLGI